MRRRILCGVLICLLCISGLSACRTRTPAEEDTVLMTIDGTSVDQKEGVLYLELTRKSYERRGGIEIWSMSLNGRDSAATAGQNALDSLIRTKIMAREYDPKRLTEQDLRNIERSVPQMIDLIGEDHLKELGITEKELRSYMEESYRALQYERSMTFLPGSREESLSEAVEEKFIAYAVADRDTYLHKAAIDWIMIYTGEWIEGRWVSYPALQKQEKREKAEEALQRLEEGSSFALTRNLYSEESSAEEDPVLSAGVVRSEEEGVFYRGQIEEDAAQAIFKTPAGENTGIIDTSYGYLIAYIDSFSPAAYADRIGYIDQLNKAREEYRTQLMQQLSKEQREAEYDRLLQDADVIIHDEVWNRVLEAARS
ncbi:MAG: peptidyl-prolyl cis-trans isomerase [Clostridiales bacterium]|nr:peptidyl-prolyl cis-trans isomerase [Clostridiales bacterium]